MKINAVNTVFAFAISALVAGCGSTPAFAGGYHGGYWVDDFGQGYDLPRPGHWYPSRRHGGWRHGHCDPGEAVEKARHFGLRRAGVERVTRHEIMVTGRHHGHRVVIVFDRTSRHCRIIGSHGL